MEIFVVEIPYCAKQQRFDYAILRIACANTSAVVTKLGKHAKFIENGKV